MRFPDPTDLLKQLRFWPRDGRITLGEERMVLLHLSAMVALRAELVAALGVAGARTLLTRVGYISGHRDGEYARSVRQDGRHIDLFAAGPQLHALEGMASVTPVDLQYDIQRGEFRGEFTWDRSAEVDAQLEAGGRATDPACWMLVGYASGYTTVFMGRPVIYRELACRACGARRCRILGRPLGDEAPPPEFEFLAVQAAAPAPAPVTGDALARPPVDDPHPVVGAASGLRAAWSALECAALGSLPVLIEGEAGVGKRHLARALHARSPGAAGPFVSLRCGGLAPEELREAHAQARGGSLLLVDLDELAPALQPRLLQLLDRSDGSPRWLATARKNLRGGGELRDELTQRLAVYPVYVPPLRERREDIPRLMHRFLRAEASGLHKALPGFTERATDALLDHDYPGNVRELWARVARAALQVGAGEAIDRGHLFTGEDSPPGRLALQAGGGGLRAAPTPAPAREIPHALIDAMLDQYADLEAVEEALIRGAVARADGNLAAAARQLGLSRAQLAYRYRKTAG